MRVDDDLFELDVMTVDDLPGVQVIERYSFPTPWSMRAFLSEITENDCAHYLVIRRKQQVVGYIGVWIILDEGHITNIAVHPAWRRKGLGTRLLTAIFDYAYQRGVRRLTLEVRVSNHGAQSLYEKLGFKRVGIRPGYYLDNNEDAVIMWKELTENETNSETYLGD